MKTAFLILLIIFTFSSCRNVGDYQYVIKMQDGTLVKAWRVESTGGGLSVVPPWGDHAHFYYLSSDQYIRADYVGSKSKDQ